jgi:hypothetical protein
MLNKTQIKEAIDNAARLPLMVAILPGYREGVQFVVIRRQSCCRVFRLVREGEILGEWSAKTEALKGITWALAALEDEAVFRAEADRLALETGRRHYVTHAIRFDCQALVPTYSVVHWPPAEASTIVYQTEG